MKTQKTGTALHEIKATIQALVSNSFPDCSAEFVGDPAGNRRRRSFGFRIVDSKGKTRTDILWVGPSFYNQPNKNWLLDQISHSDSTLPD